MLVHVLHNSLMLSLIYFGPQLQAWGWDTSEQRYLPLPVMLVATGIAAAAFAALGYARSGRIAALQAAGLERAS
jgi:hypothetical protein